ncbi:hypothetical protein GJ744_008996 [Endocarpon pusillum]|uniref:Uncharacterized protein n=1 Tax=Endocarpon pusillum TaxID=364733 RepID=A0A8H7E335_9EURO|nr:hypothetical protein GJ744_008996 [Endocarpon pusillum]
MLREAGRVTVLPNRLSNKCWQEEVDSKWILVADWRQPPADGNFEMRQRAASDVDVVIKLHKRQASPSFPCSAVQCSGRIAGRVACKKAQQRDFGVSKLRSRMTGKRLNG